MWRAIRAIVLRGQMPTVPEVAAVAGPGWTVGRVALLMREDLGTEQMLRATDALVELGRRRRLHALLSAAAEAAATQGVDAAMGLLESEGKSLAAPTWTLLSRPLADLAGEAVTRAREAIEERERGRVPPSLGLPTGLPALDHLTGGLEPGDLWVLAGRPSTGKTSLALQIALHQRVPVLFVSAEVLGSRLARKALASFAGVRVRDMRMGLLDAEAMARLEAAMVALGRCQVVVDDRSRSVAAIQRTMRQVSRAYGAPALVVVDYLQLLEASTHDTRTRQEVVAAISRGLKALALEHGVAVLALSQLSRAAEEDQQPELRHLRESGAIEQDADVVVLIHRPPAWGDEPWANDPQAPRPLQLNVAKQRDGETAYVPCTWDPRTQTVQAVDPASQVATRSKRGRRARGGDD